MKKTLKEVLEVRYLRFMEFEPKGLKVGEIFEGSLMRKEGFKGDF